MSKPPLVSIIIPTYNRAHLIGETLDSVLAQTYTNWECIIVDDGSTDDTEILIKKYIAKDTRFRYYKRPENLLRGPSSCRNYGLKMSQGEYINWFDSDDIMLEYFLEKRVLEIKSYPETDIVFCSFIKFDDSGDDSKIKNNDFSGDIIKDFVESKVTFGPPSFLIKKSIVSNSRFNEKLTRSEDTYFFFLLFTSSTYLNIKYVPEILFKIRVHKNSITYGKELYSKGKKSQFYVFSQILEYFSLIKDYKGISKFKGKCINCIIEMISRKCYFLSIKSIFNFKHFSLYKKIYLLNYTLIFFITGRGYEKIKKNILLV
jgi:glycosyltransferase involved in cell wall biosynthesis